ncbi:glycosyltransferase (plasmid) [Mesorhizobium sp. WSM2240]|uniref:Glycosyltransferase n=3 Tax=Mesorhizobium TaxID=68287 RepID=A0AAU8DHD5_9HYPH
MPTHNAALYLRDAVASVLSQDMPDFELLVLDDGSNDGSFEYLRTLADPRITISRSEKNIGLGATLTRGLDLCKTEFFVRMDADDIIEPTKFSKQIAFLHDHPEIGLVGTQFHYFGAGGARAALSPRVPLGHDAIVAGLHKRALTLVHGSLMGRTEVLRRAGGYRVRGMGEDWDMFLRASETTRLANLPDDLYRWRLHNENARLSHIMEQQRGIDFACDCATRRTAGQAEQSFDEFVATQRKQALARRLRTLADLYALAQYRIALTSISAGRPVRGYARLALAASCSPTRSVDRVRRMFARGPS